MIGRLWVCAVALGATFTSGVVSAEEVVVPLYDVQGFYGPYDARSATVDAGISFYGVDGAYIEWQGEGAAGYAWENGPECPGQWVVLPLRFAADFFDNDDFKAYAYTDQVGEDTYPSPEPFDTVSLVTLSHNETWEFLLDGECEVSVQLDWVPIGFCTYDVTVYPWGVLDSAQLVIVGVRAGDLDGDGDVDLDDFELFGVCFTGPDGEPVAPECGAGDFDRDDDIDCDDWGLFKLAWTGPPDDPPAYPRCDGGAIPAVSEWGMVALTLLMLTGVTLVYMRRRPSEP